MDDGDNPEYPHQVFEALASVFVEYRSGRQTSCWGRWAGGKSCPARLVMPPADGVLLRHRTWFWRYRLQVDAAARPI
jgi:hypothetical protein